MTAIQYSSPTFTFKLVVMKKLLILPVALFHTEGVSANKIFSVQVSITNRCFIDLSSADCAKEEEKDTVKATIENIFFIF